MKQSLVRLVFFGIVCAAVLTVCGCSKSRGVQVGDVMVQYNGSQQRGPFPVQEVKTDNFAWTAASMATGRWVTESF